MLERQPSNPFLFLLTGLTVWRLTALVVYESGPFQIFERLRRRMVVLRLGELSSCFHCLGLWVAAIAVLVVYELNWWSVLLWLAVAGAVSIVERWLGGTMEKPINDDV